MWVFGVNEIVDKLDSIDSRLLELELCVRKSPEHGNGKQHLATGHWNDRSER